MRHIIVAKAALATALAATVVSAGTGAARAADFDYGYAPPPPPPVERVYERPVIERPVIVEEQPIVVEPPRPFYRPYYRSYGYFRPSHWPRYAYGWHPHGPRAWGWDR